LLIDKYFIHDLSEIIVDYCGYTNPHIKEPIKETVPASTDENDSESDRESDSVEIPVSLSVNRKALRYQDEYDMSD
jgi:hypothetical protein